MALNRGVLRLLGAWMGWGGGLDPPLGAVSPPRELCSPHRYTYEIAPVFVLMEEVVLAKLRELVGWSSGDGIFSPGTRIAPGGLSSSSSPSPNPGGGLSSPPVTRLSLSPWQEAPSPTCTP